MIKAINKLQVLKKSLTAAAVAIAVLSTSVAAKDLVIAARDGIYGAAMEQTIAKYNQSNPDVKVELLKLPYANLYEKLVISLKGNASSYDLVLLDDTWATEFMKNDWLKELKDVKADFVPAALNISKYPINTGKLYSVPLVGNVEMMAYRADLLKKHGFDGLNSWTEVVKAAKTINENEADVAGIVFRGAKGNPIVTGFLPIFWANGGEIVDSEGNVTLNSEAGQKALDQFLSLKPLAPKGVEIYNSTEVRDAIQQGKAAIAIEVWPSWVPSMDDPAKSKVVGKMTITAAPGEVKGPAPMLGIWQLGITKGSKNADTARQFLDFMTSAENQKALALELGLPPTRSSVYTDADVVSKYRWYPAQLKALENGKPRPRIKKWKQVETVLGDYLQLALVGQMPAKQALKLAAKDITRALRKK
ncbi:MAG: ABC transporter substrate-binding protein [Oceanospirillaceae bacterium]